MATHSSILVWKTLHGQRSLVTNTPTSICVYVYIYIYIYIYIHTYIYTQQELFNTEKEIWSKILLW